MNDFLIDLIGNFGDYLIDPTEKVKIFKKELELIEAKHLDFFKHKKSPISDQEHDSIFNHCKIYIGYDPAKFFFTDNVVPEHIQRECFDAFTKIFEY